VFSPKKIVIIFCAALLISSIFIFPTSAIAIEGAHYNGIYITNVSVSLTDDYGNVTELNPTGAYSLENPSGWPQGLYVEVHNQGNTFLYAGSKYYLSVNITTETYLETKNNYVLGGFSICLKNDCTILENGISNRTGTDSDYNTHTQKAEIEEASYWSGELKGYRNYYDKGIMGMSYSHYTSGMYFQPTVNKSNLLIYLFDIDFEVLTAEEYASQSTLDKEKDEAQSSGNSASEDVGAVMPNDSAGFSNALENFVQAMSTTETECKLSFPALKIPALEGLFPETVLSEESEVTFSKIIALIPEAIMAIIRALTTIGLIVYCFKELYDTISEALTRRKANE